jgi:carbon-monoxide dehydrogenase large subunit
VVQAPFAANLHAHLAVTSLAPLAGVFSVERMVCADDAGLIVNPVLAARQLHGGIAQGLGEVLLE